MKRFTVLLAGVLLLAGCARTEVRIPTDEGTLVLRPLLDNAIRVCLEPADYKPLPEFVYTEKVATPKFSVNRKDGVVEVQVRAKLTGGSVLATKVAKLSVNDVLDEVII